MVGDSLSGGTTSHLTCNDEPRSGETSVADESRSHTTSHISFLQRKIRRLSIVSIGSSRSVKPAEPEGKGPLGLNLLHEPSEPHIDFVFVHGISGGSRKTWSYSSAPGMFWPKEWLPNEVGFKHVRLHSYGYNSDWTTRGHSPLTLHDFGQALLADLHNSPYLRKNGDTPIVFVAHSMGGLVVKKAFLLATRDPTYHAIGQRIHTMYFLGTPHRGADSAQLGKLLRQSAGYGTKAFLDDLVPGCGTLDQINDEFRHVCSKIHVWSFSEAVPTSFGLTSSLVVDKESAVLGLPKEHVQYMESNHRNLCKFDTPLDPNYIILQRAFLTTIEDMGADIFLNRRDEFRSQMKKVASLLRVDQRPDAALLATNEKQHLGSCQWLTEDISFQDWVYSPIDNWEDFDILEKPAGLQSPKILWLNGRPGTGKSVATGHVIRYLQSCNLDCSFYFFSHKDRPGSNVSAFLRSLAFQMAESSFEIRRAMASMAEDDIRINHEDHHMLWTSLFVERIFKLDQSRAQYWVIDAVDECSTKGMPALISMLSNLDSRVPLRVFMTSRPGGHIGRFLTLEKTEFMELNTGQEGSLKDIELLVKARLPRARDVGPYRDLVTDVLAKSNGIFLWASLTVAKLEDAYSVEDKQDVLRQIPPEMDNFYSRIVASVAESPSSELAKCILKWTICSPKPLHIGELSEAVKLDIGRTLTASGSQIETMTGHLVFVDNQSRIHITHQTTSAFLTQQRQGIWIDRIAAHSQIAEVCLNVLCGPDFAPPRMRRGGMTIRPSTVGPLSDFAALNFSYHLMHGSSAADAPLLLLNSFLRSNVLTWIEKIASTGNLWTLQLTAQRLRTYLGRRAKYQSPVSLEIQTVTAWATDIYHLVAAFHSNLLVSPSSIYFIIPHLCPPKSIIRQLFAKSSKRLRITGPLDEDWNDRLACYMFPEEASAIACCGRLLAVGLTSGDTRLYYVGGSGTFDLAGSLAHGRKVRYLAFNKASSIMASCSARKLALWDVSVSKGPSFPCLWSRNLDFTPSSLMLDPEEKQITLTNPQHSAIITFRVVDGQREEPILLHASSDSDSSDGSEGQLATWTPSDRMRLDGDHKLAAMAYRNASVTIWDLSALEKIGNFEKEGFENVYATPQTLDMIFNPVAELELLAITYKDGDIVTCNPWTLDQTNNYHLQALLVVLAATSDGRILAGAAEDGGIYLFHFETLQPLYQIDRPYDQLRIHEITFSADNLQFLDIRGNSCNVWEPFALVPKDESDDSSSQPQSEEYVVQEPPASHAHVFQWGEAITCIEPAANDSILLVGRQDGTIDICDTGTGDLIDKLRFHDAFIEVNSIEWHQEKLCFLSVDSSGRCIITRLTLKKGTKPLATCLLDHRERGPVRQAFLSPKAELVLIRNETNVKVVDFGGSTVGQDASLVGSWWMNHPSSSGHLIAFQRNGIHLFDWGSLKRLSDANGILFVTDIRMASEPWIGGIGSAYVVRGFRQTQPSTKDLIAVETAHITTEAKELSLQILHAKSLNIHHVLGSSRSNLLFLDSGGWVCSIGLKSLAKATHYIRHFFIPLTWRTGYDIVMKIISKTVLAIGRGEQLILFHGFLEFEEKVAL